jgi:hypothetical protein
MPFQKGQSGNPSGLPGRTKGTGIKTPMHEAGYTAAEVRNELGHLLTMSWDDRHEYCERPEATTLQKWIDRIIIESAQKGDYGAVNVLFTWTYGKPKETIELTAQVTHKTQFTLPGGDVIEIP